MQTRTKIQAEDPLRRLWNALIRPPYMAVPWAVFCYVLISCLIYTDAGPFTGHIVGFDDQARMVQVLQWINGGGWYDRLITRVNAPEGFQSIWARIVDIPIAAIIVTAQIFVGQKTSALVASVLLPLLELALLFWSARYFARPIAGKAEARLVILFVMFTTVLNHKIYTLAGFHVGEASHHAWYGILNVLMFGAVVRVVMGVAGFAPKLILGGAIALLLAVGIEGFPTIAGMVGVIAGLSWFFRNHSLARRGAEAMGLASLLSLALLPMHVPPAHVFDVSFLQPSIIGPIMTAAAAAFLLLQHMILKKSAHRWVNAGLLLASAGLLAFGLVGVFPEILGGATTGLSPNERILASSEHPEVWAMVRVAGSILDYIGLVMPTLIALAAGAAGMKTAGNKRRRMMFGAYLGCAAIPGGLAQIYWRYIHHAETAACPLLLWAWQCARMRLPQKASGKAAAFLVFVLLGPFWMLLLPALLTDAPFLPFVAFFPAKIYSQANSCDTLNMADYLNKHYAPTTRINVPDQDSADFLYQTDLKIDFLANFPSHDHFIDNRLFFTTNDADKAKEVAARHGFDLVAVCKFAPLSMNLPSTRPNRQPIMLERLAESTQPDWLKPVTTGVTTNYVLYEVDHAALTAAAKKEK